MNEKEIQSDGLLAKRNTVAGGAQEETQEIDLLLLFNALRRHILIIIAVALLFALGAGIVCQFFITPLYTSTTSVYLVSANDSLLSLADIQLSSNIAPDYVDIIKSRSLLEHIISEMELEYTYEELYENVDVVNPTDTHIIKITVTDPSPKLAKNIANNLTTYAVEQISMIMEVSVPYIYDYAIAAEDPSFPSLTKTVVIAFVLGAVLAAGVIIFIAVMDTTVKTAEDIEQRCGMVTLTKVYYEGGKKKKGYGYGYGGYGYGYGYGYGSRTRSEVKAKNGQRTPKKPEGPKNGGEQK